MGRTILLNPGPVTLSERVRTALLHEDVCHREPEYAALIMDIRARLIRVYEDTADEYTAVILTGSGTCAVEAMLATLIPRNGKALVVTNGVYGERMADMIHAHGKLTEVVSAPWTEQLDFATAQQRLAQDRSITHVVAVQHETTTGRLNDLARLGALCKDRQVPLLLDCVSSFGAEAIAWTDWNIAACAATANKCLHGAPGISFVLARTASLTDSSSAAGSVYLDLQRYYREQVRGYSPFTQAVHVSYALREALVEFAEQGGWQARRRLYRNRAARIRASLRELGVHTLLHESAYGCVLTSFRVPTGLSYANMHDVLKEAGSHLCGAGPLECNDLSSCEHGRHFRRRSGSAAGLFARSVSTRGRSTAARGDSGAAPLM